jgi:hypothetical protein
MFNLLISPPASLEANKDRREKILLFLCRWEDDKGKAFSFAKQSESFDPILF